MPGLPLIAVCIATYKRPRYLSRLLESINCLQCDGFHVHIVVADNDACGDARSLVEEWGTEAAFPFTYVIEPERGIASVRNRLVFEARTLAADYLAFIDDDEIVSEQWLNRLVSTARSQSAGVVTGPVIFTFSTSVPDWVSGGGFFQRNEYPDGTVVSDFYTCNVLIDLSCLECFDRPFDTRFSLTGGSDVFLANQLVRQGVKIVWSSEAVVYETVPQSRATASWLIRRWYRFGMVRTRILFILEPGLQPRIMRVAKCIAWFVQALLSVLPSVMQGKAPLVHALQRCAIAAGGIAGAISSISYQEYKETHGE